jgi:hypothetical protein
MGSGPLSGGGGGLVGDGHPRVAQPRGPAVNRLCAINGSLNNGGGRRWTYRQHPQGGPPSMSSSTILVASVVSTDSTPRGSAIDVLL